MSDPINRPADIDEIVAIMGSIPDSTVAAIAALGATAEELAEARAWLDDDAATARDLKHRCEGRVAQIVELLVPDDEEDF